MIPAVGVEAGRGVKKKEYFSHDVTTSYKVGRITYWRNFFFVPFSGLPCKSGRRRKGTRGKKINKKSRTSPWESPIIAHLQASFTKDRKYVFSLLPDSRKLIVSSPSMQLHRPALAACRHTHRHTQSQGPDSSLQCAFHALVTPLLLQELFYCAVDKRNDVYRL